MASAPTLEQYIKDKIAAGKKDTPANRKAWTKEWNNKYRGGDPGDWKTYFKTQFPQYASLLDGGEGEAQARAVFGDDLIDLFLDAAKNPDNYDFLSEAGLQTWDNKVKATKFYQNLLPVQREWDILPAAQKAAKIEVEFQRILSEFADLKLTDVEARTFATHNLRNAATALQQKYYGFSLIDARTPSAIAALSAAAEMKRALKAYNFKPDDVDKMISSALTQKPYNGTIYTEDSLLELAKNQAKLLHPHWADQIDKGNNLDAIFGAYAPLIASTLELNQNTLTKETPLFKNVLDWTGPDGKPITGPELTYKLKSDPAYKWGFTRQAHKEVHDLIQGLQKDFGMYK